MPMSDIVPKRIDMISFRAMLEANTLPSFSVNGDTWTYNQTKSNSSWMEHIIDRAHLSREQFIEVTTKGIQQLYKETSACKGNICLRMMKSKFILVLNFDKKLIITVRDSSWENMDNGQCNKEWVFEEKDNPLLEAIVSSTEIETDGYSVEVRYKDNDIILEYKDKCDCCFEYDL